MPKILCLPGAAVMNQSLSILKFHSLRDVMEEQRWDGCDRKTLQRGQKVFVHQTWALLKHKHFFFLISPYYHKWYYGFHHQKSVFSLFGNLQWVSLAFIKFKSILAHLTQFENVANCEIAPQALMFVLQNIISLSEYKSCSEDRDSPAGRLHGVGRFVGGSGSLPHSHQSSSPPCRWHERSWMDSLPLVHTPCTACQEDSPLLCNNMMSAWRHRLKTSQKEFKMTELHWMS